jgi:HAD superfamily hydrolase (TIGR01509 family)
MKPGYDAVLLDVDGTLVASNDAHARAWVDVLREHGFSLDFWQVRRLVGMGGDLLTEHLVDVRRGTEDNDEITSRRGEIFRERYLGEVTPIDGARELVRALEAAQVELVIATSASEKELRPLLERAGLEHLVDRAVNADDAEHPKPCPDIVAAACDKVGVSPSRAVLVGDTPYDQEAAQRAGVAFVAVLTGGWARRDFDGAEAVVTSVADLVEGVRRGTLAGHDLGARPLRSRQT